MFSLCVKLNIYRSRDYDREKQHKHDEIIFRVHFADTHADEHIHVNVSH